MNFLKKYTATQYVSRLLAALSFVLMLTLSNESINFNDHAYYESINFTVFLLAVFALFAVLYFISNNRLVVCFLLINMTLYFILAANTAMDNWFSVGLCVVLCIAVYYFDTGRPTMQPPSWSLWLTAGALVAVYAIVIGIACCRYYWDYWTPTYDFGIFTQMFHYMKETGQMLTTCERDELLSHFAVHASPIYYVLLPFYCLFPTPETLLIACAAIVASGIIPLVLLCRKKRLSVYCSAAFAVVYCLYPGFMGGLFYPIHENCFLVALLLWFFYLMEADKAILAWCVALLTMTVKEDAPVYMAIAAVYYLIANKNRFLSMVILLFSILYFMMVTEYLHQYGEGVMDNMRYGEYIYDDGGLLTVIKSLIQNPVFAIRQIFRSEKLLYILQMLVPLCFLPLMIRKPAKLILLIPFILVNLMTNYPYQYDIGFQYHFGSGAFLFYLAVSNFSEMGKNRSKALLCAVLCSFIIFSGGLHSKLKYAEAHKQYEATRETIGKALEMIPDGASVSASTFFVAQLSQRDEVYDLGYTDEQTEYVAVDLRVVGPENVTDYINDNYVVLLYEENVVAIFKNLHYQPSA